MIVYLDGDFLPEEDAMIPVTDRSFLYGDGCFDAVGVWAGRLIDLDAHITRFFRSARMMRIEVPVTAERLCELVVETAARNDMADGDGGSLRVVLSRGSGTFGVNASHLAGPPTLVIMAKRSTSPDLLSGHLPVVRAHMSTYARSDPMALDPRVKVTSYATAVLAFLEARDHGADMAILRDGRGFIAEAHIANVFVVQADSVGVPPRASALDGVTRRRIVQVARRLGYACDERPLTAYDLRTADEAFVTSASSGVSAIAAVDGQELPGPVPGPVTRSLARAYADEAYAEGTEIPAA